MLLHIYTVFHFFALKSYYYNKCSYTKLKNIFLKSIEQRVIEKIPSTEQNQVKKDYYNLKNYSEFKFLFEYKIKRFFRTNFPVYMCMYSKLKHLFLS